MDFYSQVFLFFCREYVQSSFFLEVRCVVFLGRKFFRFQEQVGAFLVLVSVEFSLEVFGSQRRFSQIFRSFCSMRFGLFEYRGMQRVFCESWIEVRGCFWQCWGLYFRSFISFLTRCVFVKQFISFIVNVGIREGICYFVSS